MTVSFKDDVRKLFGDGDDACMAPRGVKLRDYEYMSDNAGDADFGDHANARHVLARLEGTEQPAMPLHSAAWPEAKIAIYRQWIGDGFAR